MNEILIFLATILPVNFHLENTNWAFYVGKGCIDTIKFNENHEAVEFDCELNYSFHGSFIVKNDILLVTLKDDSHAEDRGKISFYRDKYLVKNNSLYLLSISKLIEGKWKNETVKSKISVIYHKIK